MPSTGSCLPPSLSRCGARLEQCQVVSVRVREIGGDAVIRLDGRGVLELQAARSEDLDVLATIVRLEHPVVPAASRFWMRARIQLVLALEENHLDVGPLRRDREPAGAAGVLIIRPLLQAA